MPEKKRVSLPVLGSSGSSPGELPPTRGRGAWVVLGALTVFAVLVPAMMLAATIVRSGSHDDTPPPLAWVASAAVVVVLVSSFAGGYVVGRFGGAAGPREGALAGALAGLALWALSRMAVGGVMLALTTPVAWAGARWGRRSRQPGDSIGA